MIKYMKKVLTVNDNKEKMNILLIPEMKIFESNIKSIAGNIEIVEESPNFKIVLENKEKVNEVNEWIKNNIKNSKLIKVIAKDKD
ncbi:MAG: hypothetical protein IMY67_12505 [Bacteroidetes bacterium]|nr:hypothetical protein [Bacteroidota bacterium]